MSNGQARPPMVFDRAFLTGVEGVTELIFVRHGEQHIPDPRSGPVGDTFDPPLSERGEQQALHSSGHAAIIVSTEVFFTTPRGCVRDGGPGTAPPSSFARPIGWPDSVGPVAIVAVGRGTHACN